MSFLSDVFTKDFVSDMNAFITEPSVIYRGEQELCRVFLLPIASKAHDAGCSFPLVREMALRGHLKYMTAHPDAYNTVRATRFVAYAKDMIVDAISSDARAAILTYLVLHKVGTASQVHAMKPDGVFEKILDLTVCTSGKTFDEMPDPLDAPVAV